MPNNNFQIVGKIALQGPGNIRNIVRQIQGQLNSINAPVQINIPNSLNTRINTLNNNLQRISASLLLIRQHGIQAAIVLQQLSTSLSNIQSQVNGINITVKGLNNIAKAANSASDGISSFGGQAGLAIRRFLAFAAPTSIFLGLVAAIKDGVSAAIDFEKEMIRLSQVTGKSVGALSDLSGEITRLATGLGVSSKELGNIATTLAQAGLSAKDTKTALEALARSSLAATFTDIEQTTEGAIAVFRQFSVGADDLQGVIGSLNSVSAQFAVESDDLISAIRRTGGAFKASGGNLNELLGLFTSVRATTRESADSIATGFRTIFTRIQRPKTIQFLKELGIQLQDAKGQFVGPLESIKRLNAALSEVPTTDPRFASVIEELGGFRQVSKVIPLIQQFPEALKAISVAEQGQLSIVEDSVTAQKSLANQIVKVREEFLALFRELTADKSFQFFAKTALDLAKGIIDVTRSIKPLIPLLGSLALIQGGRGIGSVVTNFSSALSGKKKFATGGIVPGQGNGDTVPAMLTPGEFVINKKSANAIGFGNLAKINKYAAGGPVRRQFGVAGLQPVGLRTRENYNVETKIPVNGKTQTIKESVDILSSGLSKEFANKSENIIRRQVGSAASSVALGMQKAIGAETSGQPSDLTGILKKSGFDAVVGHIFEAALSLAGAPYTNSGTAIDFPKGLGDTLGKLFNLPGYIPTDAKRTADDKDFKRRNLPSFLRAEALAKFSGNIGNKGGAGKASSGVSLSPTIANFDSIKSGRKFFTPELARLLGDTKLKKADLLANPLVSSNFNFDEKRGFIKKAEGGSVPGTGSGDTVPALLTPGEFVINKQSASKIGFNTLGKINKYAKGGRVGGGSGVSGTSGLLLASGLSALIPSFEVLDKESESLVKSFSAVASAAGLAVFSIKGLANEATVAKLSRINSGALGSSKSVGKGIVAAGARNLGGITLSTALIASVATVVGQKMQSDALINAKNARSSQDLNAAIKSDKFGSTLAGAGVGAASGAAIGTIFAPGVGTAVGAGLGAGVGALVGAINTNQTELIKVFRQASFDKVNDKLDNFFDDFSNKRVSTRSSATNIGSELRSQIGNIKSTANIEQRGELTKQFRNNLVNIRNLSNELAGSATDLNAFKSSFGGAGQAIIDSISLLTKKSIPDVEREIQNEINIRKKSATAIGSGFKAEKLLIGLNTFQEALLNASDSLDSVSTKFDDIGSLSSGDISSTKFNAIPANLFERAVAGNISNSKRVGDATGLLTGSLGSGSSGEITKEVTGLTKLNSSINGILGRLSSNVGLGSSDESAQQFFDKEIDLLKDVPKSLRESVKEIFASETTSRQGGGEGGILAAVRGDLPGFASKLVPESSKALFSNLSDILKLTQDQLDTIGKNLVQQRNLELNLTKEKLSLEDKIYEITKSRLKEGESLSFSSASKFAGSRRSEILKGTAFAGASSPSVGRVGARLEDIQGLRESARSSINSGDVNTRFKAQKQFIDLGNESNRLREYLKDLGDSTIELTNRQEALAKAEADRKSGRGLVESLFTGGAGDRVAFSRFTKNAAGLKGGKTFFELGPQSRREFDDFLSKLPQNKKISALGGLNVEDFRKSQLNKFAANSGNKDFVNLVKELTSTSKDEDTIRKEINEIQNRSVAALSTLNSTDEKLILSLDKLNASLLSEFPKKISEAISAAQLSIEEGKKTSKLDELNSRTGELSRFNKFGSSTLGLTGSAAVARANKVSANASLFNKRAEAVKSSKEFQNFKLEDSEVTRLSRSLSDKGTPEGVSKFLGKTLDQEEVNKFLSKTKFGNSPLSSEFSDQLQKRLESTKIIGATNGQFTTPEREAAGFQGSSVEEVIKDVINAQLNMFKTQGIASANTTSASTFNELKQKGFSSGEINQFSNTENFNKFTQQFDTFDKALTSGTGQFDAYIRKVGELNSAIAGIDKNIAGLRGSTPSTPPIAPLSAPTAPRVPVSPLSLPAPVSGPLPTFERNRVPVSPLPGIRIRRPVRRATGGLIPGSGVGDTVPALLTPGEFVLNKRAVNAAGLSNLSAFNSRFANGGPVQSPSGSSNISIDSADFSQAVSQFSSTSNALANSLSRWSGAASQLSESLASFPSEIQVNHSPITVAVNIAGLEGLESSIADKVLTAVNDRLASNKAKAADGKSPFFVK